MAALSDSRSNIRLLKVAEEELVSFLEPSDLASMCTKAAVIGVISSDVRKRFDSLDPNVPRPSKVRYLLIHAYEQLEAKPWLLERWLQVLCSHGVPSAVLRKAGGVGTADVGGSEGDRCSQDVARFYEEHVTALVDILASCSDKWRHICMSLNLPRNIKTNLEARLHMYDDVLCLSEVLHEWIVGHHKHAKAPTLENLKKALKSRLVGLGKTASQLDESTLAKHGICFTLPVQDLYGTQEDEALSNQQLPLVIVSQPKGTEIAEGKSTLLEVEAVCTCVDTITYQWVKDECPLKDDGEHYLGSNRSILCITASLATEGTYTCEVRTTLPDFEQQAYSNPAVVRVDISHSRRVLVDMYRAQSEIHRDAWPPVGNRTYINLALVKQDKLDIGDEYSYSTIQGDVDDVILKKESIGYDKAFGEYKSGALLLIEGRPGSGKTTLVHKVSQDWATGKPILKGAKLVFLISLRVLSTQASFKMVDIMKLFHQNDETACCVLKELDATNGEGVCFILDGLDEFDKQESVVFKLIRRLYLQRSMVILSSRPSATFAFRCRADVYIEVIGFLKNQIREYILNYPFTCRGSPQSLLPYLDQHPNVLCMCYLPVHVAMVSFLHDRMEGSLPSTECGIYIHFVNFTLLRKEGSRPPNSEESLMRICERAYEMTVSHQQVFKDTERSLSDTCCQGDDPSLGLVTVDSTAGLYGYHHLYTFVHLTFQEYLAAYYISKLGEQEQWEVISKYGHMDHMRVVWKFYCGLVSFKDEDPKFTKILDLQHNDQLFHCQCAFESQQPATCKSVVLHNHSFLIFKATHLADFTCLRYVISNSSSSLKSLKVLDISRSGGDKAAKLYACANIIRKLKTLDLSSDYNELDDEDAKILCNNLGQCSNLSELSLCYNSISDEGARVLGGNLKQCSNLSKLHLSHNKIGEEGAKGLGEGLKLCSNLSELGLGSNFIGSEGAKHLVYCLIQCSNLSKLYLDRNDIGGEGVKGLSEYLGQCRSLSVLHLGDNTIDNDGAKCLGDGLRQCSNLSKLFLNSNGFGNDGVKSLCDSLGGCCSNLSVLHLGHNSISGEDVRDLFGSLRLCSNLSILNLDGNKISDVGARYIGCGLSECSSLSEIHLDSTGIGAKGAMGARGLIDGLRHCNRLSTLHLGSNDISDDGAMGLGDGLGQCSNLSLLYLSYNKISDAGAKSLGDGLRHCSNLSVLYLDHNKIGDDGAKGLGDGLKQCSNLSVLYLDHNKIGDDGAKGLGDGLSQCSNLSVVYLDKNRIGDEGAKSLGNCLKQCSKLSVLKSRF